MDPWTITEYAALKRWLLAEGLSQHTVDRHLGLVGLQSLLPPLGYSDPSGRCKAAESPVAQPTFATAVLSALRSDDGEAMDAALNRPDATLAMTVTHRSQSLDSPSLEVGAVAILQACKGKPELNGERGTLCSYVEVPP